MTRSRVVSKKVFVGAGANRSTGLGDKVEQVRGEIAQVSNCKSGLVEGAQSPGVLIYVGRPIGRADCRYGAHHTFRRRDDQQAPSVPRRSCIASATCIPGDLILSVSSLDAHSDPKSRRTQRRYRAIRA